ncbi:hypothetical protein A3860_25180 [Niastella vici]|uniref:Trimeric autotransporter adhesin YadA-like head domain-containing protein n=1 Tax=Niastella vici TaxID=1703345 RepID=A0A1V9FY85_9BACT|nr:hypothetical protein [Niastella vici]OQP63186.1 hypothetical protein A3860_25180 [Niastella vici]
MKQLFLFAVILLSALTRMQAQNDFTIKADNVIVTNDGSPAELIIANGTKNIKGLLVNKGNGQTEFRQAQKLNDSTLVFGTDTFTLKGSGKGLQQVTDADNTTTHYINANGGYYQRDTLLLYGTDSIIKVGFNAGKLNTSEIRNTVIGYEALQKNVSGSSNTAIGYHALQVDSGYYNIAVGYNALNTSKGSTNVGIGEGAMTENTTGGNNIGIGRRAGGTATGSYNVAVGRFAHASDNGVSIGTDIMAGGALGISNTAVGNRALGGNSGDRNTGIGDQAFYTGSGSDNTAIGYISGTLLEGGQNNRNTIVGASPGGGRFLTGVTAIGAIAYAGGGINNTYVGYLASSYTHNSAYNNTIIGSNAGKNIQYGLNNLAIGYSADVPSTTDSFQLSIGNLIYGTRMDGIENTISNGKIGIKTKTPAYELDVNGKLGVRSMDSITTAPNVLLQDPASGEIKKAAFVKKQTFAQTATATVTGTTTETTLIAAGAGSLAIPAASWFAGKSFRVVVRGVYSSSSSNPANLIFKIKLGSTVIAQTSGIVIGSGKTNVPYEVRGEVTCRSTGASGTVFSRGLVITDEELVARLDNDASSTTVDLGSSKTLDVTVTMSNNATGNSVSSYIVTFEAIN